MPPSCKLAPQAPGTVRGMEAIEKMKERKSAGCGESPPSARPMLPAASVSLRGAVRQMSHGTIAQKTMHATPQEEEEDGTRAPEE